MLASACTRCLPGCYTVILTRVSSSQAALTIIVVLSFEPHFQAVFHALLAASTSTPQHWCMDFTQQTLNVYSRIWSLNTIFTFV